MSKYNKLFSLLATFALSGAFAPVWGQTAAAPATTPATTASPTAAPTPVVTVDGLVDAYYSYNFTNSSNKVNGVGNVIGEGNNFFYNNVDNSFTLGLAEAKMTATLGQTSGHLVLAYDQESSLGLLYSGLDVLQAYVSYNPGQWTINAGRFVTWMGYEVIESNSNWNYSHSLLFTFIPLWHTGLSVNYAPSSTFNITGYAVDGNNNTQASPDGKNYGLEAIITPNSMWTITLNGLFGPAAGNAPASVFDNETNMTGEGIFVYKPDSMWSFALDAQYGMTSFASGATPSSGSYWGLALYGRDQIASDYAIALRLEDVTDSGELGYSVFNGTSYVSGSIYEATLTLEHNFSTNLLSRLEGRYDTNSVPTGVGTATAAADLYANGTASSQFTATASMVFSY